MKVVLAEKVSPATLAVFQAEPGWQILTHDQVKNLPEAMADADALVVRSAVQVDDALMAAAPKLRVIGRAGVGVDNIDAEAATRRGIVVMNTPGANAIAVAELALGLMIALARQLAARRLHDACGEMGEEIAAGNASCATRSWAFSGWAASALKSRAVRAILAWSCSGTTLSSPLPSLAKTLSASSLPRSSFLSPTTSRSTSA